MHEVEKNTVMDKEQFRIRVRNCFTILTGNMDPELTKLAHEVAERIYQYKNPEYKDDVFVRYYDENKYVPPGK